MHAIVVSGWGPGVEGAIDRRGGKCPVIHHRQHAERWARGFRTPGGKLVLI